MHLFLLAGNKHRNSAHNLCHSRSPLNLAAKDTLHERVHWIEDGFQPLFLLIFVNKIPRRSSTSSNTISSSAVQWNSREGISGLRPRTPKNSPDPRNQSRSRGLLSAPVMALHEALSRAAHRGNSQRTMNSARSFAMSREKRMCGAIEPLSAEDWKNPVSGHEKSTSKASPDADANS